MSLLKINNLSVEYRARDAKETVRAVNNVNLDLARGETLGLVGESGCGKTSLCNSIVGLVSPSAGDIWFDKIKVAGSEKTKNKSFRENVQMVFQDPMGSLNPRLTIESALAETLYVHRKKRESKKERHAKVLKLLSQVGLDSAFAARYPHELSGGQRQRIGLARALAVNPSLLIADEPVSALDVSVQVQILNLIKDLQSELNLALLFIAHDLSVVRYMCDRVLVMYLGRIVESGSSDDLFNNPAHPYTKALLSAVPSVKSGLKARKEGSSRIVLEGEVPSAMEQTQGCPFCSRCPEAEENCRTWIPESKEISDGHQAMCWHSF